MNDKVVKVLKFLLKNAAGIGIAMMCSSAAGSLSRTGKGGWLKKAAFAFGGAVIGGMIIQQSDKYLDGEIDRGVELTNDILRAVEAESEKAPEKE